MQKSLERSHAKLTTHGTRQKQFNKSSRRLLKDLEAKGIVRIAVDDEFGIACAHKRQDAGGMLSHVSDRLFFSRRTALKRRARKQQK